MVADGNTTVPEFKKTPFSKFFTFLEILFLPLLKYGLGFQKTMINFTRSKFENGKRKLSPTFFMFLIRFRFELWVCEWFDMWAFGWWPNVVGFVCKFFGYLSVDVVEDKILI